MKAEAVVFTRANAVEFCAVDCPDPDAGDVVVRVTHSWISNGTEGSSLRGERVQGDVARREDDPEPFPIVPGYQKVGVIEWVGGAVDDLAPGETVFCALSKVSGMFSGYGGHISPSVSPRDQVWKLPGGPDPVAFSGMVLAQVGYNCGSRAPVREGEAAVVIGDGLVGQWSAQTLALRGAQVVLVGRHDERLARFTRGTTLNSRRADWAQAVRERTGDRLSVAVDTVGSRDVVEQAIGLLCHEGHLVSAGFYGTDDLISMQALRHGEKSLDSVSGWSRPRMDATCELISTGRLETLPLVTHRFAAREAARAWEVIREKRDGALGVVLHWQ